MTSKQNNSSMLSNEDSLEFETEDVLLTMESLEYFSFFGVMASLMLFGFIAMREMSGCITSLSSSCIFL